MAKLVLLLVFVCFQFSSQEELLKPENELVNPEIGTVKPDIELVAIPTNYTELDGADENQWQPEKDDDEWTEEDEEWLQEILDLLKESDEDYDSSEDDEFDKLMEELDKYFGESDESDEDWYKSDENWDIDLDHYPDYFDNQKEGNAKNDYLDVYYSWLYKLKIDGLKNRKPINKRFTSV